MHRFFNDDMIVDDSLYKEIDLKKAYYNYSVATLALSYDGNDNLISVEKS
jgi:hypothetical protein